MSSLGHTLFSLLGILNSEALEITASPVPCRRNSAAHQDSQCPVPETWGRGHVPGGQMSITETGPRSSPQIGTIGQCWTWEEEMGHAPEATENIHILILIFFGHPSECFRFQLNFRIFICSGELSISLAVGFILWNLNGSSGKKRSSLHLEPPCPFDFTWKSSALPCKDSGPGLALSG